MRGFFRFATVPRWAVGALLVLIPATPPDAASPPTRYDLWIRNGTIVDGSGHERFAGDVLINGDTIERVGTVAERGISARRTIDASGKVVAPGFIDTHAHGDPSVNPSFANFLAQGVTTVVLGQDGNTAGFEGDRHLPDIATWRTALASPTSSAQVATLAQWMQLIEQRGTQVNVATLSGHGSLREIAGVGNAPQPSPEQMSMMKEVLRGDLAAGAFGLSLGLEYIPGRYSGADELMQLGATVGEHDAVVMSHMRSEDDERIASAIDELLAMGAQARVHVSHIKIVFGQRAEQAQAVLAQLQRARERGVKVTADVYPISSQFRRHEPHLSGVGQDPRAV